MASGMAAAAISTPADVVKTRLQVRARTAAGGTQRRTARVQPLSHCPCSLPPTPYPLLLAFCPCLLPLP